MKISHASVCAWMLGSAAACSPTASSSVRDAAEQDSGEETEANCAGTWVETVSGRVEAESIPLEGARPQLCLRLARDGVLLCLAPPTTDDTGHFTIELPPGARCVERATFRVFKREFSTPYCHVELAEALDARINIDDAFQLARTSQGLVGESTGHVTVSYESGLQLAFPSEEASPGVEVNELRSAAILPSNVCGSHDLDALYAFSPEGVPAPGVTFTVPAPPAVKPGSRVDLFLIGGLGTTLRDGTEVPEGALVKFAEGVVGKEGLITPSSGSDLPHLAWLGVRMQ